MKSFFVDNLNKADEIYLRSILDKYKLDGKDIFRDSQFAVVIQKQDHSEEVILYVYFDGTNSEFLRGCDMVSMSPTNNNYYIISFLSVSGIAIDLLGQELKENVA